MSTTTHAAKTGQQPRVPMTSLRKTSLAAGVLYLITFVSIPTLFLYGPVREPSYLSGAGPDTGALIGGLLEIIVALAGIGTAVTLFPVLRRQNESVAVGFVGMRVLEAATIFAGVVSLLSIVTLRQAGAGTAASTANQALSAQYHWTFLLGQALIPGINAVLLGSLMYKSRLVPRWLPTLGLIGAPIIVASVIAKYFGVYDELSAWSGLAALPVAVWEFSLGIYLTVKGFKPCRITAEMTAAAASPAPRPLAGQTP
ncbi:MAG TPA: DUF4386 domain-containing protein [Nakamurella multipartita]|nr:DUF4386 domain-containing protein [Nakamurella multipartita]